MTKSWDLHEATIKRLYAENTLAAVRVIMIDKYNFKASRTRAYRGRLIKWGVRKYNRRRSDCGSSSCGSLDGSIGSSDFAFINSHREAGPTGYDLARYSITRHNGDSEQMPSTMSSSAASTDIGSPLSSEERYVTHQRS
ncbi:hypothetical protein F4861DRAFT_398773 [Xylaria intraflava]|nr:hypothetical protein F4861DRAFT_398773 [Xylaria intraflava]